MAPDDDRANTPSEARPTDSDPVERGKCPEPGTDLDAVTRSRLQRVAAKIAAGDLRPIAACYPATATTARGLAPCATPHYLLTSDESGNLVNNHFRWWERNGQQPVSGPMGLISTTGEPREATFECQFSPALATVAGANVGPSARNPDTPAGLGFRTIPWDTGAFQSPNEVPGLQFAVRVSHPWSNPLLKQVEHVDAADVHDTTQTLLVNEGFPGPGLELRPGEYRPSLWIDFETPQRAVGIEYGYEKLAGRDGRRGRRRERGDGARTRWDAETCFGLPTFHINPSCSDNMPQSKPNLTGASRDFVRHIIQNRGDMFEA